MLSARTCFQNGRRKTSSEQSSCIYKLFYSRQSVSFCVKKTRLECQSTLKLADAVVGDNKKNSNVFLAVTDVSPTHIWEKAYKTNGIAMLVPFTANSDIARASLKLKNNFFYDRERPEMFYTATWSFSTKPCKSQ